MASSFGIIYQCMEKLAAFGLNDAEDAGANLPLPLPLQLELVS